MSLYIPRIRHDSDADYSARPQPSYASSAHRYPNASPSSAHSSPTSHSYMEDKSPRRVSFDSPSASSTSSPHTPHAASFKLSLPPQTPDVHSRHRILKKERRRSQESAELEEKRSADEAFWADLARQSNAFNKDGGARYARPSSPAGPSRAPTMDEIFPAERMPESWVRSFGPMPQLPAAPPTPGAAQDWAEFEGPLFPAVKEEVERVDNEHGRETEGEDVYVAPASYLYPNPLLTREVRPTCGQNIARKVNALAEWVSKHKIGRRVSTRRCARRPYGWADT